MGKLKALIMSFIGVNGIAGILYGAVTITMFDYRWGIATILAILFIMGFRIMLVMAGRAPEHIGKVKAPIEVVACIVEFLLHEAVTLAALYLTPALSFDDSVKSIIHVLLWIALVGNVAVFISAVRKPRGHA